MRYSAKPDYQIALAIVGVSLAISVPFLKRTLAQPVSSCLWIYLLLSLPALVAAFLVFNKHSAPKLHDLALGVLVFTGGPGLAALGFALWRIATQPR